MKRFVGCICLMFSASVLAEPAGHSGWDKITSAEYIELSTPSFNPQSDAKVVLGEKLFNDKHLSANGKVSCATCHDPKRAFTDGKVTAVGMGPGARNSPTIENAMFSALQFWDGRAPDLEEQAKLPIINPVEMGVKDAADAEAKIQAVPEYKELFKNAFESENITFGRIAYAIAAFERTKISTKAPFDRFMAGEAHAISAQAKRGWAVFNGQGRCVSCHGVNSTSAFFNDNKFHNIGVSAHKSDFTDLALKGLAVIEKGNEEQADQLAIENKNFSELGRFLVTKNPGDVGAFKTPTLRNVMVTSPYMHDGSLPTLWDVMDHYNKGGVVNPYLDGGMHRLALSEAQIDDVVAFLATLTSPEYKKLSAQEFARQKALSRKKRPERNTALAFGKKGDASDADLIQSTRDPSTVGPQSF